MDITIFYFKKKELNDQITAMSQRKQEKVAWIIQMFLTVQYWKMFSQVVSKYQSVMKYCSTV